MEKKMENEMEAGEVGDKQRGVQELQKHSIQHAPDSWIGTYAL